MVFHKFLWIDSCKLLLTGHKKIYEVLLFFKDTLYGSFILLPPAFLGPFNGSVNESSLPAFHLNCYLHFYKLNYVLRILFWVSNSLKLLPFCISFKLLLIFTPCTVVESFFWDEWFPAGRESITTESHSFSTAPEFSCG